MENRKTTRMTDYDMQQLIGQVLRYGVLTSGIIAIAGGIWYLFQQGSGLTYYTTFKGEPAGFTSFTGILKGITEGSANEIIQLGVVILIATPVIRIVFSLISFILEKNTMYIIITMIVLSIILFSMLSGFGG